MLKSNIDQLSITEQNNYILQLFSLVLLFGLAPARRTVKDDMEIQFRDVTNLDVLDWVVKPFRADVFQNKAAIQENLIDLENDQEAQATFRTSGWHAMWATHD